MTSLIELGSVTSIFKRGKETSSLYFSGFLLVPYTINPFSESNFPIALPIPKDPPVTNTTFNILAKINK